MTLQAARAEPDRPRAPGAPWRADRVVPAALVVAAAASVAAGIGRRSLWLDESLSVGATSELVRTWTDTGGTMGAYYALLAPWSEVSTDRAWLRALSALLALGVLPLAYRFARRLDDRRFAVTAVAVLGGSWAFTRYAQEARSYALAMLLVTVSWLALVRWAQAERGTGDARRARLVHGAAMVAALLSHGLSGLHLLAQLACLAARPERSRLLRGAAPATAASFVVLGVLNRLGARDVASWVPPLSLDQLADLVATYTGPSAAAQLLLGAGIVAGAAVAVRRALGDRRAGDPERAWLHGVVVAWALLPPIALVGLSSVRPYLVPRYVIGSLPALALLLALAVEPLRRRPALAATALLVVAVVLGAGRVDLYRDPGHDWAGAAAIVAADGRPDDVVAFPTQAVRTAFDRGWDEASPAGPAPQVVSPLGPLGEVRRWYLAYPDDQVPDRIGRAAPPRVWVVGARTVGRGDTLTPFLRDPALRDYREVRREAFPGGIDVVLLVRG